MARPPLKARLRGGDIVSSIFPRPAERDEARAKLDAEREAKRFAQNARFADDPTAALFLGIFPGAEIVAIRSYVEDETWLRAEDERRRMQAPPPKPTWWSDDVQVTTGDWINAHESRPETHGYSHAYARKPGLWSDLGPRVWRTMLHRNQWTWYPQRQVDGQRKPAGASARVDTTGVDKTRGISPKWLAEEAASPQRTDDWVYALDQRRQRNVQVALPLGGAASMFMAAEDGDVDDPAIVARIDRVRAEHLPETPYVRCRHGSVRTARLFRQDPADPWGHIPSLVFKRPESDPDAKGGAVEFLATAGQSLTILGRHYKTQDALQWRGLHPGLDEGATPFRATVVTGAQMRAYVDALRAEFADDLEPRSARSTVRNTGEVRAYEGDAEDLAGLRLPERPHYQGSYSYDDDGRVRSPRDTWLYNHVRYVTYLSPNLRAPAEAIAKLIETDLARWVRTDRWPKADAVGLDALILEKVRRRVAKRDARIAEGFQGYRVARIGDVEVAATEHDYESDEYSDADIRALVPRTVNRTNPDRQPDHRFRTPANPERAKPRALLADRSALTEAVSDLIGSTLQRYLDGVAGVQGLIPEPTQPRDRLAARREAFQAHDAEIARLREERSTMSAEDPAAAELEARMAVAVRAGRTAAEAAIARAPGWKALAATVLVLKGPTGSGKTTTALAKILGMKARLAAEGKRLGTQLFFAPSHSLLGDVAKKAAALTTDAVVMSEEEAQALMDAAKEAAKLGLKVRIYRGRGETCTHPAWATLREAGISGQKLCKSTRRELVHGEWKNVSVTCEHLDTCVFWTQRLGLADIDILFMPSAYLVLPIPEEVRAVATGVIADESIINQFLGYAMMPIEALGLERTVPRINKREEANGLTADVLIADRHEIRDVVRPIVAANKDPAAGLLTHDWGKESYDATLKHLNRLLDSAVNVCGRALDVHEDVSADMQPYEAAALVKRRAASRWVAEEKRFWSTVRERVRQLINDRGSQSIVASVRSDAAATKDTPERAQARAFLPQAEAMVGKLRTAKGDRDHRIQTLNHEDDVPTVRVSYRRKNSFADLPTLLMDASADRGMIEKIYKGRPVEVVEAACPPHLRILAVTDRSMSDTSLLPYRDRNPFAAAQTLTDIRTVIDGLATLFGHSQVGVASTLSVELAANTAWRMPANASWLHYNNVVGFDWLKFHPAMVVVGRQELPIGVIDALVGALTYDDDQPEQPVDFLGTGLTAKGDRVQAIVTQRVQPMRDGSDLTIEDRTYAGAWAQAVQAQAREEQVRQAIGRLRPVYRAGRAPLLVYVGRALPGDLVVDAVASLHDVVQSDACRLGRDLRVGGMVRYRSDLNGPAPTSASIIPKADDGAHVQEIREGRHHTQRGLAAIEVDLTCGRTIEGLVPMVDLSKEELLRRVDRHLGACKPPRQRKPGTEVRVINVPERDTVAIVRADDPKMVLRLGDRLARQAAEDAAEVLAAKVSVAAHELYDEALAKANRTRRAALIAGPEVLASVSAMATVLTVRKRAAGECAADLGALFVTDLPEVVRPAMARAMAGDEPRPVPVQDVEPVTYASG